MQGLAARARHAIVAAALAGVAGAGAGCAPADTGSADEVGALAAAQPHSVDLRPAVVPRDFVVTPFGYFHPSCVVHVAQGERTDEQGIVPADGRRRAVPSCAHSSFDRLGRELRPDQPRGHAAQAFNPAAGFSGWMADANIVHNMSFLSSNWTVPRAPQVSSDQVIYLFPGVQPVATNSHILQPVLEWHNGQWTVAPWDCCRAGTVFHGDTVNVSSGDRISGYVAANVCTNPSNCTVNATIGINVDGGFATSMDTSSNNEVLNWIFGGVLETYNIDDCNKLPPTHTVSFTDVSVFDSSSNSWLKPTWRNVQETTTCVSSVTSSSNTVTINW
jgi:hypothetical protein